MKTRQEMKDKRKKYPTWFMQNMGCKTPRDYRALKRKQAKDILRAMDDFQRGCCYSPGYEDFSKARNFIIDVIEKQKVKNWKS